MNITGVKKATSIRLKMELYKRIEKVARREHRSVSNLIELALENVFNYNIPNKETVEAIEEIEKGATLSFSSVDELFQSV